ncbi:hypothetical protein ACFC0D_19235 [Streptomyces sp. NPDC056222]|uniref:hypothetical protein n=1 Tax=Streptomyces sp. NPDC056222 TaxID=3345749 RepID=UPI0035DFAE8F
MPAKTPDRRPGVQLREAPSSRESRTDPLSFRDLMAPAILPHERIASMNFLFENEFMKKHKLMQVVDVVFGVHDDRAVELGQRIRELGTRLTQARSELAAARAFVEEQDLPAGDALTAQAYERELLELNEQLHALDGAGPAGTAFVGHLRREHQQAAQRARKASAVVRDCETQLARMMPLRAQYADDLVKPRMLAEAQSLLDPLSVTTCPACLHRLPAPPSAENDSCTLCSHELPHDAGSGRPAPSGVGARGLHVGGKTEPVGPGRTR